MIAALSGPILGERAGWRRWLAIAVGFLGVLVILRPGIAVFSPAAAIPLLAAVMFGLYGVLTRLAAKSDPPAVVLLDRDHGRFAMTLVGVWHAEPMTAPDAALMAALCVTGVLGHWLLIRAYDLAEASTIQPFAYFQLVLHRRVRPVRLRRNPRSPGGPRGGHRGRRGLFTLWRERRSARRVSSPGPETTGG